MSDPVELREAVALLRALYRRHRGSRRHVGLQLNFGEGDALAVRVEVTAAPGRGEWAAAKCGRAGRGEVQALITSLDGESVAAPSSSP